MQKCQVQTFYKVHLNLPWFCGTLLKPCALRVAFDQKSWTATWTWLNFLAFCQSLGASDMPRIKKLQRTKTLSTSKSIQYCFMQKCHIPIFYSMHINLHWFFSILPNSWSLTVALDKKLQEIMMWQCLSELFNAKCHIPTFYFCALEYVCILLHFAKALGPQICLI